MNTFIVRCGEVALKGMNKPYFERVLLERIRRALKKKYSGIDAKRLEGLIFIRMPDEYSVEDIISDISKVFGVASVSHAVEVEHAFDTGSDMKAIGDAAVEYMLNLIETRGIKTFKVETKRADKNFPIESPKISKQIGGDVLKGCKVLSVDVHDPDCRLFINIRHDKTYIFADKIAGFGGLPLGTNGRGLILLSGGIDSPVAAWMMAKRGMLIEAVHFHSYPYTSERAKEKVLDLTRILAGYCGRIRVHTINLLEIQQAININCPADEMTIISRRFMMKLAESVAKQIGCVMLITGENLGQVASQTAEGIVVTDNAVEMPVMRPLIALDKVDIMEIARTIGTFETSIMPFEDCCTVFLPKHPVTKPKIERILESEAKLDVAGLIESALAGMEIETIYPE